MNKGYWIIVSDFDIALEAGEIPFGSAEELGLSGREKLTIGQYQGSPAYLVKALESDNQREFAYLRSQLTDHPNCLICCIELFRLTISFRLTNFAENVARKPYWQAMKLQFTAMRVAIELTQRLARQLLWRCEKADKSY